MKKLLAQINPKADIERDTNHKKEVNARFTKMIEQGC